MAPERGLPIPRPRWRSFRLRLVLVILGVALLPLIIVSLSHWDESHIVERMEVAAEEAAAAVAAGRDAHRVAEDHQAWVRQVGPDGHVRVDVNRGEPAEGLARYLFGPDGAPSLRDRDASLPGLPARPVAEKAMATGTAAACESFPGLVVCHAAVRGGDGSLVYVMNASRRAARALTDVRYQLIKLALGVLPLAVLLAFWLGWRMTRPLEALRRQSDAMVQSARAAGLQLRRDDEFGDVAEAFNRLLAALDERRRANETFVADLAHEFKNPVAAIRSAAESLSGGNADPARVARLARALGDSAQRLDALVTQFMELARAEAGLVKEPRVEVEVGQLARGIAQALRAQEPYKDVNIAVDGKWSARVVGVPGRLESALRNLMDNGASFAGPGGWVRVLIEEKDDRVHVRVSDSGPGIAAEDLPRVFERFYTTRGERRGTGLGLALVRAVVEAHGGHVHVESPPEQGAVFEMVLPVAP